MTYGILTALLHPIRPRSPRSEGEESSAPVSLLPAGALPTNSPREQWIVDQLRKVEGQ